MGKKISEMTMEELWRLFPIFLTEHQNCWEDWYGEERRSLTEALPAEQVVRISHIGSTAVSGICAKPIVDILLETSENSDWKKIRRVIIGCGYLCMRENESRISFNKGYTENGFAEKVYHLHLRRAGDNDELYFRDYLTDHAEVAREYEKLKLGLWKKYEHDRDAYTESKTAFVRKYTSEAKRLYSGRYN